MVGPSVCRTRREWSQCGRVPAARGAVRWGLLLLIGALGGAAFVVARWVPRRPGADLRVVESVSIATLDPAAISVLQDIRVVMQLYEGLTVFDPPASAGGAGVRKPALGCAERYEVDAAGTVYRFHLRSDARWSNGDAVTPDDFLFAWQRAIEPGTAQDYAFFLDAIAGLREYVAWRRTEIDRIGRLPADRRRAARDQHLAEADRRFKEYVGLRTVGPQTLEIRLEHPVPYWLDLLSAPVFLPLHRATVERFRRIGETGLIFYDARWTKPGATVYNGPFVLDEWRFKRSLTLRRNPAYWDRDRVRLQSVEILDVADPNTAWLMYAAGRVDWIASLEATFTPELVARADSPFATALNHDGLDRNDIHAFGAFGTYFYNFNCLPELPDGRINPFADPRVRRAFALAVDKQALCKSVLRRAETPAVTLIPPGAIPGYPTVAGLPFDPPAARRLLADAGYPDAALFPEVVIRFNNESYHGLIAQSIAAMFHAHLGVRVRVEGKESQSYREDKQNHRFMIARASWFGDYTDPTTFLDTLATDNGNNDSAYTDPAYDALLRRADAEPDAAKRLALLAQAETRVCRETLPILPLFHYVNIYAFDPARIRSLTLHPRLLVPYKRLEVVR